MIFPFNLMYFCYLCQIMESRESLTYRLFEQVFGQNREMLE